MNKRVPVKSVSGVGLPASLESSVTS